MENFGRYADFDPLEGVPADFFPGFTISGTSVGPDTYRLDLTVAAVTTSVFFGPNGHPFDQSVRLGSSLRIPSETLEKFGLDEIGAIDFQKGEITVNILGFEKTITKELLETDLVNDLVATGFVDLDVAEAIGSTLSSAMDAYDKSLEFADAVATTLIPFDSLRLKARDDFARFHTVDPVLVIEVATGTQFIEQPGSEFAFGEWGTEPEYSVVKRIEVIDENYVALILSHDQADIERHEVWYREDTSTGAASELDVSDANLLLFDLISSGFTFDGAQYRLDPQNAIEEAFTDDPFNAVFGSILEIEGAVDGTLSSDLIDYSYVDLDGDVVSDDGQTIYAGAGDDSVFAGAGNDSISDGGGDDAVSGGAGDDTFLAGNGSNSFDGGAGADTIVLSGARADYTVTSSGSSVSFVHFGGLETHSISGVESVEFSDETIALSELLASVPPNTVPSASGDTATVGASSSILIDVLANDADADGDALSIASVTGAANGTAVVENGQVRYTADTGFVGTETLIYEVADGQGGTSTASVVVR